MSDVSIKVSIAGRVYPLTVNEDEEQLILSAAEKVESSIDRFQQNYAVRDKQDLLAMAALQMATSALKGGTKSGDDILQELKELEDMLDSFIDS